MQRLSLLPGRFAVCQLPAGAPWPPGPTSDGFCSVTRTDDELSIVCPESAAPAGATCEPGWRILKIAGPFDFSAVGILASVAGPLAAAGIGIFAVSTYDTDYVLVKERDANAAVRALETAGHRIDG